jgi:DNA polymerase III alpha subunit (gram-positive type)
MNYLFIDVETGGLNPQEHSLLSLAIIVTDDKLTPLAEHSYMFSCDTYHVSSEAMNINNLNLSTLRKIGVDYSAAREVFSRHDKAIIAGWNVAFDVSFIKQWVQPEKMNYRMLDVQSVFRFVFPQERGSLADAARTFELHIQPNHSALLDAAVTLQVAQKLKSHICLPD